MRTEAARPARGPGMDFETVIMRFEAAWESGTVPDLVSFVPPDAPISVLVEIVLIDMERRFKIGGQVNVERYLAAFPALADDIDAMAALIETECRFRRRFGPPPETGEYARRFPHLGTVVQRLERATVSMGASPAGSSYTFPTSAHLDPAEGPGEIGRLGRYRVTRVLGKGGMGVVYAAEDPSLKRMVALKLIRPEYDVELSAGLVARFRAEAEAVAAVRHANVVQVYEVGEHSGRPYIALEYIDGGSLEAKVAVAPLPPRAAAELLVPVARAVHAAHQRNIIHRDLKPANILLTAAGEPKVTDFGLAKRLDQGGGLTQTGAVMGTPYYMAPEQARGDQKGVGTAADVWALGAILYRVLGGRPPFQAATADLTYQQILHADSVPLRRLVPGLPRDLETACAACLHKDPAKRYSSAAAFADDLDRYLTGRPILARPLGLAGRADRWVKRNPRVAALAGSLAIVIVAGMISTTVLWRQANDRAVEARTAQASAENAFREATASEQAAVKARTEAEIQQSVAEKEADKATAVAVLLGGLFEASDPLQISGSNGLVTRYTGEQLSAQQILDRGTVLLAEQQLDPEVKAKLQQVIGGSYLAMGQYEKAAPLLEAAERVQRSLPDAATSIDLAATLGSRAFLAHTSGLYPEALRLYEEALATRDRLPGRANAVAAAATQTQFAILLAEMERHEAAAAMATAGLEARRRLFPNEHREIGIALLGQAIVAMEAGDPVKGLASSQAGIRILAAEGDETLSRSVGLFIDAIVIGVKGKDLATAERMLQESLDQTRSKLTDHHVYVALTRYELAVMQDKQGKVEEAERNFMVCFEMARGHGWLRHPKVAMLVEGLVDLLTTRGKHAKAKELTDLWIKEHRVVSSKSIPLADALTVASGVHYRADDFAAERKMLEEADAIFRASQDLGRHRWRLRNLVHLGFNYGRAGRWADAERVLGEALDREWEWYRQRHGGSAEVAAAFVKCQFRQGKYVPEAAALLTEAISWEKTSKGGSPPKAHVQIVLLQAEYHRHAGDLKKASAAGQAAYDTATARNDDALEMMDIAQELLRCAADPKAKSSLSPQETADLRGKAILAVSRAVDLKIKNVKKVLENPIFDAIRSAPEIERLLEKTSDPRPAND